MISVRFQGKPFNITVIQAYAPTSNSEESEVEQFYEDLQDLVELTPRNDVLFIIGDWNANVGSQETPGKSEVSQSCLTLCDPTDWGFENPHEWDFQARILEWAAIPFSRVSSQPRDQIQDSCIVGGFFTS